MDLLHLGCEAFAFSIPIAHRDRAAPFDVALQQFPILVLHPCQSAAAVEQGLLDLQFAAHGGRQLH